ncbi:sodium calcium exchanger 1- hypothetical protein [Limosa lapponica baueri]|uniref:Sodium/calcium exchanger membrane region domain-containing protein n=1 Tax=Limosa lapponica baueri TaxID=1758121 RepID=A0A2I0U756_LIMLA|nr:sodium calcium exchanger 1- hypothetical protein [Limosa lapponica baueri]
MPSNDLCVLWEGARKSLQALMMIAQKIRYWEVKVFYGPNDERWHLGGCSMRRSFTQPPPGWASLIRHWWFSPGEDDDDDECGEEKLPSCFDYVMHFLTVFWKVLFAFVPPTDYWNGWACFVVSILMIGLLTAFIGDLASHFGCTIGLKDSVTAVVFVALGTSVPDTFASKVAATQDQYADASIGNVTGSNAVNVFLGIGVAWSIAAIYHAAHGQAFQVSPGTLAFSVTLFTIFAFISVGVLLYRRRPEIGGLCSRNLVSGVPSRGCAERQELFSLLLRPSGMLSWYL